MKKILAHLLFLLMFLSVSGNTVFAQTADCSKAGVKKMIDYIHDRYREDYTSFGNSKILDWQKAVVSMMFVHAYEVLGETKYLDWANDALYVEYNLSDDQCWGANAILELNLHDIKPAARSYKDESGTIFTMNYSYQDIFNYGLTTAPQTAPAPYFGYYDNPAAKGQRGIFWNRNLSSYNTCTLGQAIILAFRMPEKDVSGKSPQEFGSIWLRLQNNLLIDQESGLIFDNYQLKAKQSNKGNYAYNNGIVLGALGLAWQNAPAKHSHVPDIAAKVVNFVTTGMAENGVLYSPSADFRNNNSHAFNGIFMHFVPFYLFSDCPADSRNQLKMFVGNCAAAVWNQIDEKKDQADQYSVSYSWHKPFNPSETNCMTTVSGAECLLTYLQSKENILPFDYQSHK